MSDLVIGLVVPDPQPHDSHQADLDLAFRVAAKRAREKAALERAATRDQLRADLTAYLLVWRTRDNIPLSDTAIEERVNNIITGLTGNFRIERNLP